VAFDMTFSYYSHHSADELKEQHGQTANHDVDLARAAHHLFAGEAPGALAVQASGINLERCVARWTQE
jgi:hypothetical protein